MLNTTSDRPQASHLEKKASPGILPVPSAPLFQIETLALQSSDQLMRQVDCLQAAGQRAQAEVLIEEIYAQLDGGRGVSL